MRDHERTVLARAGLRATTQRIALLHALYRAQQPQSVEQLVRASRGALDLATAYRTLDTFVSGGLVRSVELSAGKALYEIAGHHHHHIVCTSCNRIADVNICLPEALTQKVRTTSGFARIAEHTLEFFGLCTTCARKS